MKFSDWFKMEEVDPEIEQAVIVRFILGITQVAETDFDRRFPWYNPSSKFASQVHQSSRVMLGVNGREIIEELGMTNDGW